MKENYGKLKIEAGKLACYFNNLYYPFINGLLDCDIIPSKYPKIVLKRIKRAYYLQAYFNV